MEYQEASKDKFTLNVLPGQFVDLEQKSVFGKRNLSLIVTLSPDIASVSFMASAKTRLPFRVNHL